MIRCLYHCYWTDQALVVLIIIIFRVFLKVELKLLTSSSAGTVRYLWKNIYEFSLLLYGNVYLINLTVLRNHPLLFTISVFLWLYAYIWAYSLESLMEGHNWFLNQFVEILQEIFHGRLLISYGKRAGLKFPAFDISCSWPPSRYTIYISRVLSRIYIFLVFRAACVSYGMKQNMFFSTLSLCSVQGSFAQDTKEKGLFFQCCGSG